MPWAFDTTGVRRKVACGPCVRGHRSSKCHHWDRVLFAVRKPGRPLSSCPHTVPATCNCNRDVVYYAVPDSANAHGCPIIREANATDPTNPTNPTNQTNRVQKTKNRRSLNKIEKRLNGGLRAVEPDGQNAAPGDTVPNNASQDSSSSSSSQNRDVVAEGRDEARRQLEGETKKENEQPRLRLGMMGVGGYGAAPDEIGWAGEWPNPAEEEELLVQESCYRDTNSSVLEDYGAKRSCCCSGKAAPPFTSSDQPGQQQQQIHSGAQDNNETPTTDRAPVAQSNHAFTDGRPVLQIPAHPSMHSSLGTVAMPPYSTMDNIINDQQNAHSHNVTMVHPFANGKGQDCTCGDACLCFACAKHPMNSTMTKYVRLHYKYLAQIPQEDSGDNSPVAAPDQQPHVDWQNAQLQIQQMRNHQTTATQDTPYPQVIDAQHMANSHSSTPHTPSTNSNIQWQFGNTAPINAPQPTSAFDVFDLQSPRDRSIITGDMTGHLNNGVDYFSHDLHNNNLFNQANVQPQNGDYEPAIDRSLAFSPTMTFNAFVVSGCRDVTGTCQCGDGCPCQGCLTHGGHNGVRFDGPSEPAPHHHDSSMAFSGNAQHEMNNFATGNQRDSMHFDGPSEPASHLRDGPIAINSNAEQEMSDFHNGVPFNGPAEVGQHHHRDSSIAFNGNAQQGANDFAISNQRDSMHQETNDFMMESMLEPAYHLHRDSSIAFNGGARQGPNDFVRFDGPSEPALQHRDNSIAFDGHAQQEMNNNFMTGNQRDSMHLEPSGFRDFAMSLNKDDVTDQDFHNFIKGYHKDSVDVNSFGAFLAGRADPFLG